jgi:hypothetical protein
VRREHLEAVDQSCGEAVAAAHAVHYVNDVVVAVDGELPAIVQSSRKAASTRWMEVTASP